MSRIIKLHDRSRAVADWKCERYRFWGYEAFGTGITGEVHPLELFMGTTLHDGLAAIATQWRDRGWADIDEIAALAYQQMLEPLLAQSVGELEEEVDFAKEQATLVEGLLRGFYKQAWPRLVAAYPKILFIEEEMTYPHDGMVFMSKPDLIVATEDMSETAYIEYKSTSSKKAEWMNSWNTAIQLHSTVKAVEATKGVKVTQVIVQGLYKGHESFGKQASSFCYAYKKNGQPPFSQNQVEYAYKAGFKRYPTWELEGGVKAWVEGMPENVLAEQFPQSPPIFIKDEMVDRFFKQRSIREQEIDLALQMLEDPNGSFDEETKKAIMDTAFPQRFDQCVPSFGKPCAFRPLCHGGAGADPFSAGYVKREPHHKLELDIFQLAEGGRND